MFAAVALPDSYTGAVPIVDNDLEEALRRSQRDNVEHDDLEDLAEAIRRSREDAAPPRDPDAELAEALRRSREDSAPPRRDVVKTDRDHPIVLDDSQEDAGPIVLDESQEEVAPARPSAEEVRAARLARLG